MMGLPLLHGHGQGQDRRNQDRRGRKTDDYLPALGRRSGRRRMAVGPDGRGPVGDPRRVRVTGRSRPSHLGDGKPCDAARRKALVGIT
jgi:hypothetical protein